MKSRKNFGMVLQETWLKAERVSTELSESLMQPKKK